MLKIERMALDCEKDDDFYTKPSKAVLMEGALSEVRILAHDYRLWLKIRY